MTANHINLLNQVQKLIISIANDNGINLADNFTTVEDFKNFVIGFAFRGLRDSGASVADAFDATLGQGEYEALFNRLTA